MNLQSSVFSSHTQPRKTREIPGSTWLFLAKQLVNNNGVKYIRSKTADRGIRGELVLLKAELIINLF